MLTLKHLPISSFNENLAYINRDCSVYKIDDINSLVKIEVHGGLKTIYAFLQVVNDPKLVKPNELALNNEAFKQINLPEGAKVSVSLSSLPPSLNSIKRKVAGNILSSGEYSAIINDITARRYSNMDIASFLVASGSFQKSGLATISSTSESLFFSESTSTALFIWAISSFAVSRRIL